MSIGAIQAIGSAQATPGYHTRIKQPQYANIARQENSSPKVEDLETFQKNFKATHEAYLSSGKGVGIDKII
jgi:hypothetical protein